VAMVVAETLEQAKAAAALIDVDYEVLTPVVDTARAFGAGSAVHDEAPDNQCYHWGIGDKAGTDAAFAQAAHVTTLKFRNNRLIPNAIEPRAANASYSAHDDSYTLYVANQNPHVERLLMCAFVLGIPEHKMRVVAPDVGGGFGSKIYLYGEETALVVAAKTFKRPVKWTAERSEAFLSDAHGRDHVTTAQLALDKDGHFLGLRADTTANMGAYLSTFASCIPTILHATLLAGQYKTPKIWCEVKAVFTNTAPVDAYRGAGRPESIYVVERLMDEAARVTGLDPAELRRRNLVRPQQMPYTSPTRQVYDSGEFERMLDQALVLGDWGGYPARAADSAARGRLRGRSVTTFLEWTGGNALTEKVQVQVRADGIIELSSATMAMGQGIATSYAQLAVDVFGVPIDRIRILQGDTDRANGFGSAGSRSLFTGGGAVRVASERTVDHARELAAQALEAAPSDIEYQAGAFNVVSTDLRIGLFELAGRQAGGRITVAAEASASAASWPNAAHVCEVEIDPGTGEVEVVAYASVNDIGRVISPQIVQGQVEGGAVQGIGQALCERIVYDDSGQLLTASFMDYAMPHADGFLGFKTVFDTSVPCRTNLLGAKGVGEAGCIGVPAALMNAARDALAPLGEFELQFPLTSEQFWQAMQA